MAELDADTPDSNITQPRSIAQLQAVAESLAKLMTNQTSYLLKGRAMPTTKYFEPSRPKRVRLA
jgi:hypothetical protein